MHDTVDKAFGIRYESEKLMIGDKVIKNRGDNIEIDGEMYMGTPGLWASINGSNSKEYSSTYSIVTTIFGEFNLELTNRKVD